jgi:hypothetical protein
VSVPRIAAFAREAKGAKAPKRAIQGQATRLSRTVHGLDYDPVNDEIVAPVYEAGAVLIYRGESDGAAPPARIIQGDKTMLIGPQTAAFDTVHNEILVGDASSGTVMVYDRLADGNVAPKRVIRGPSTGLREITGIAADPKRNLIVVVNMGATPEQHGVFIFNRLDSGNVAPKAIIGGKEAGISHARQVVVDSDRGKIYVAVQGTNFRAVRPYVETAPRPDTTWEDVIDTNGRNRSQPSWSDNSGGFIGVWDINDRGDVPPRAVIKGGNTQLNGCGGVAISPKEGLVIAVGANMYTTYVVPQLFTAEFWTSAKPGTIVVDPTKVSTSSN